MIGRPGLILTKYVSGLMEFNPYCAGVALIFAMTVACMAFGYLFFKISGDVSGGGILFSSFVFLDTMWAEQVFYMLQEFEIVFALLLAIGGAFFAFWLFHIIAVCAMVLVSYS